MSGNVGLVYNLTPSAKEIPSMSQQSGKFLTNNGNAASWANLPSDVFIATYLTTSSTDIYNAVSVGKPIFVDFSGTIYPAYYFNGSASSVTIYVDYVGGTDQYSITGTTWENISTITYSTSTHVHGNIKNDGTLQTTSDVTIANGDKLVVTDSSNSNKVARTSLSFDGSTTSQYLSKKGSWVDVPTDIYWCTYGTTTNAQIEAALAAGKIPMLKDFAGRYNSSTPCVAPLVIHTSTRHVFAGFEMYTQAAGNYYYINWAVVDSNVWTTGGPRLLSADVSHASSSATLGVGTSSLYGHVKLSNSTNDGTSGEDSGTAATPSAVKSAYDRSATMINRSTSVNADDANYTTLMARGEVLIDSENYDNFSTSDWDSRLVNGAIAWRYE